MPKYFKGARVGSHWHVNDARAVGLSPMAAGAGGSLLSRVVDHVFRGPVTGNLISLTSSYEIALAYAQQPSAAGILPSTAVPAFVYEIDVPAKAKPFPLIDPIQVIVTGHADWPRPWHHACDNGFLSSISGQMWPAYVAQLFTGAPGNNAVVNVPARVTPELLALLFSLRDGEVLVDGLLGKQFVVQRHDVY